MGHLRSRGCVSWATQQSPESRGVGQATCISFPIRVPEHKAEAAPKMRPPRIAMWLSLWLGGGCLLAVWAAAQDEEASQLTTQEPGPLGALLCPGTEPSDPSCPRKKKAATLLPSFTKTTTPPTTRHPKTTPHPTPHTTNHTTGRPANHTTVPANHTTAPHPTHRTAPFHTTTAPHNHTTTPATNHTTPHHPTNHTTPPAILTTAPLPTDKPFVATGNYTVRNGSTVCLRMEAGLQVQVRYPTHKAKQLLQGEFAVQPSHTHVSGACSSEVATLKLRFPEGFLFFTFKKNETKGTSYLSSVQANLTHQFPQAAETSFEANASSLQEFEVSLGHSYQCRNRTLALTGDFHLQFLSEHVQAFKLHGGEFGEAEVCAEQQRSALLPIIVGVLLAILVIVVLVAFAIGRRKSHRGYEAL